MDNFDMDALDLPEIKGLDPNLGSVSPAEKADASKEKEAEFVDDYEYDPSAVPMLSEMDGSESSAEALKSAVQAEQNNAWKRKAVDTSAPAFADIGDMDPGAAGDGGVSLKKSSSASGGVPGFEEMGGGTSAASPASEQKQMSARERRMAEPFDMPGAYTPVSKQGSASAASQSGSVPSYSGAYQQRTSLQQSREQAMNEMYAQRQEHYDKGRKKAQTVGFVVIAIQAFSALSSLTSSYSNMLSKIIDIGMALAMIYMAVMFMKGSLQYRSILGRFALIDFVWGIIGLVQIKPAIDAANAALMMLGQLTGMSEAEIQASLLDPAPYIILALVKVIGYGAMVYFYMLDSEIADYAND